jgi:hypothetical protein
MSPAPSQLHSHMLHEQVLLARTAAKGVERMLLDAADGVGWHVVGDEERRCVAAAACNGCALHMQATASCILATNKAAQRAANK